MKNRRIEVRMGKTVNLGNFESFRLDIGMAADISDEEDIDLKYDKMVKIVENKLDEEIKPSE